MDEQAVYAVLTEIFREIFDDPGMIVKPEMSARDVPEWDSFNHINIVVATEMHFGIKFRAAEIDNLHNVGEFAALIARKRQAA